MTLRSTDAGDLVLMGPPGVGKGTQASLLTERRGWLQLSTGDLFRKHLRERTELGGLAESYMSKGHYVPDDVTVRMVRERLAEIPRETRVMFDGFPRTVPQAEALDGLLREAGRSVGGVVLLEAPREELVRRLGARASKDARSDDSPEVVRRRLQVYAEQTRPVVEFYDRRGVLRRVDGVGEVEDVHERVVRATEWRERVS